MEAVKLHGRIDKQIEGLGVYEKNCDKGRIFDRHFSGSVIWRQCGYE